ncbi:Phenylpropionate dioxygenase, large terminal subunit [Paenibacillus sp. UNC496MF]|uniref:aromatic ring-hydroxylating dioxygenase subunit alpha n=1 Tax=Paenibacillus sp. UNC496MF TaxID=1502753 RepID=UPI0008F373A1|nr:aromatic ring-hydroxylating dioxygenase subunit alpha [Paenibacillus sp. UNC496MF]SFJ49813.1 Phenylpropionate dioxygenase, large terminal subunit [Paenibacillus sp. UNC496MF]
MLQAEQQVLRRYYYPVMPVSELIEGPRSVAMFGEPVVVWLDAAGKPAAAIDRCCHRAAKLSLGGTRDGCIVCPYHGWTFDRDGKCTYFPQSELEDPPKVYKIKAYACEERYGYVWIALGEPLAGIPDFRRYGDPDIRQIHQFHEVIRCSALRLMENSFDIAHIAFVHHNTFGNNQDPIPPDFELVPNDRGFEMRYEVRVTNKLNKNVKAINVDADETVRKVRATWFMPFVRQLDMTYPTGLVHSIVTCATPIDNGSCILIQFVFRNDAEADVPAASVIAFDRAVVDEDMRILESTEPNIPLDLKLRLETHMHADKPGIAMRERLLKLFEAHGEREILPQLKTPQFYQTEVLERKAKPG